MIKEKNEFRRPRVDPLRPLRLPRSRQDWWAFTKNLLIFLAGGLTLSLLLGLVLGLVQAQGIGLQTWLAVISAVELALGLLGGLANGMQAVAGKLNRIARPQQRLNEALLSSLVLFPLFLLAGMTLFIQVIFLAEQSGIAVSPFFTMQTFNLVLSVTAIGSFLFLGTNQVLQYYLLRLCLRQEQQLPLRLVSWLNVMHQRKVFQRVGGSYHFLHKQLRDYLAKQQ